MNRELIKKYHAGTITREELGELQRLLTESEAFRREFLLYSQVEVTLAGQVLFHNDMDEAIQTPPTEGMVKEPKPVKIPVYLQKIVFAE